MFAFNVKDMTCGHCVGAITNAIEAADPGARVQIDLASRRVQVVPVSSDRAHVAEAISAAGYTPTDANTSADETTTSKRGGCCDC